MGNERSDFENRCFRTLFGRRNTVDATGFHYARLCARAARTAPGLRSYFQRRSGNFMVFRVLGCVIGLLGGISLGRTFAIDTTWQVILSILLGALGALGGWVIHAGAHQIHLRRRGRWYLALAVSAVWLLLGIWAGAWGGALYALAIQWLMGLAAAYGGRRSELGRQRMEEILGLRRYMRTAPREELVKCLRRSPEYYYELAPYAMALGTDRAFARQFGAQKLPECPYLTTGMDGHLTAPEWNRLLREAVSAMEQRQRRRMLERLLGK